MTLVIDAKIIKEKEVIRLKEEVSQIRSKIDRIPTLVIVSASDDKASENYIRGKVRTGQEIGIDVEVIKFDETITQQELEVNLFNLNQSDAVDGLILQLPLYPHLDSKSAIEYISPSKDADCFTSERLGEMIQGIGNIRPCTPNGVIKLLDEHMVDIESKNVVIIGRSTHVGMSLSILLTQRGATVTTCHSKTEDLSRHLINADIVVSCVGRYNLIHPNMMKTNSVLIGVGITVDENGKQQTDYNIEVMKEYSACRLVGNRVNTSGTMTILSLIENTINLCKEKYNL